MLLAGALAPLAACGDSPPSGGAAVAGTVELPPLPPPPDLALECVLPTPDASWEKARAQIGGAASFLPRTMGGLVTVLLHFPIAVSESIDGRVPAVCAASFSNDGAARGVLGVHLRWPDRLVDGLTKGQEARFEAKVDPATQITVLAARDPKDATLPSGVLGNYLLIAARPEDLTALGPYAARTMPGRAKDFPTAGVRVAGAPVPPPVDLMARVPPSAMAGAIAAAASRAWTTLSERATAVLPPPLPFAGAANDALALLPHLDGAELRVAIGGRGLRIEATAPVRKGADAEAKVRAFSAGDAAPLLAMPKDTLAGVLVRRMPGAAGGGGATGAGADAGTGDAGSGSADAGADAGAGDAGSGAGTPGAAGLDLAKALGVTDPKDASALETAGRTLEAAAGDWLAAGFAFDGTGPSGFVRAAVRDGEALDDALKELVAVAERASPVDPVQGKSLRIKTGKTVLENIPGDVYRLRLARGGAKKDADPPASATGAPGSIDVLFRRRDDVFLAATGYASRDALRALLTASPGESLAQVPEVAEPLSRLGADVLFAAFFDPGRVAASRAGKPGSVSPAPVVVGLDRTGGDTVTLRLSIEAAGNAVAEVSRLLAP